jgi:gliding motility-associated-like protein
VVNTLVYEVPDAVISNNTTNGTLILLDGPGNLCFTDNTAGSTSWNWQIGNTLTSGPKACYTISEPGTYCVTLEVKNSYGCRDTISDCIVALNAKITIPNIFTPNGDGINDVFFIDSKGYSDIHCEIYDRWGLKIYEWKGLQGYWDGNIQDGTKATGGTYYFIVQYYTESGSTTKKTGYIQLNP